MGGQPTQRAEVVAGDALTRLGLVADPAGGAGWARAVLQCALVALESHVRALRRMAKGALNRGQFDAASAWEEEALLAGERLASLRDRLVGPTGAGIRGNPHHAVDGSEADSAFR